MHTLWKGTLKDLLEVGSSDQLATILAARFELLFREPPSRSEHQSWAPSLHALIQVLRDLAPYDIGVALEYYLLCGQNRVDAIVFGSNRRKEREAVIIELKQWSSVSTEKTNKNVTVNGKAYLHPCHQALSYVMRLKNTHSVASDARINISACAYCFNLESGDSLRSQNFTALLKESALFIKGEEAKLFDFLRERVSFGGGNEFMEEFLAGDYAPSPQILELVTRKDWSLLDSQLVVLNEVRASLLNSLVGNSKRKVIIVNGRPGTGKSAVALKLLTSLAGKYKTRLFAASRSSKANLSYQFGKAQDLVGFPLDLLIWSKPLDLAIIDEAHRLRPKTDRVTGKPIHSGMEYLRAVLSPARVTVLFLDSYQLLRPDEVGTAENIRKAAESLSFEVAEFTLDTQFRCQGSDGYLDWVEGVLGFGSTKPLSWKQSYRCEILDSPASLKTLVRDAKVRGKSARLVGGYCWKWSDAKPDGTLVSDVVFDGVAFPWNEKQIGSPSDEENPSTKWVSTTKGEHEIGSVYVAQNFDFDIVGVIWGEDLVWRGNRWVAQVAKSHDSALRNCKEAEKFFRSIYRVLLTRGIQETHIYCVDRETRVYLKSCLGQ